MSSCSGSVGGLGKETVESKPSCEIRSPGSKRLLAGEKDKAAEYFKNCVATGVTNFVEYGGAVSELKALETQPAQK
jgi:hypothetical protein